MVVIAAFLAWVSVDVDPNAVARSNPSASAPGVDRAEGRVALAAGALIVGAALGARGGAKAWALLLGVAASLTAAMSMFVALVDIQATAGAALGTGVAVSIGVGVWMTGVGAVMALAGFGQTAGG